MQLSTLSGKDRLAHSSKSNSSFLTQECHSLYWFCSLVGLYKSHYSPTHAHIYFPPARLEKSVCPLFCLSSPTLTYPPLSQRLVSAGSSRLSVSSISVPHLWQMITISGPLGELPVAPWPCLLVPSSPCLHLLTCLKISALALTLQCSSVLIVFCSDWSRPSWRSFNTQPGQRMESQPWRAWSRYTISICWDMLNELGNWISPMVLLTCWLILQASGFISFIEPQLGLC